MIEVPITAAIEQRASGICMSRPIYRGSKRGREGNRVGCLGEAVVLSLLDAAGIAYSHDDETTHDIRLNSGWSIEVKTKDRTVPPKPDYDCTLPLYNHDHQRADCFVFVSLKRSGIFSHKAFGTSYVVGAISRERFDKIAKPWKAGDIDPLNGTKFWTDCLNVKVSDCVDLYMAVEWMDANPKKVL